MTSPLPGLIDEIYGATFAEEPGFRALFGRIARTVGVEACGSKTEWTGAQGPMQGRAGPTMEQTWYGLPAGFEQAFVAEYWREDPWTEGSRRFAVGKFMLSREALPDRDLLRTRFHAELCVPYGLHDAMGTCLLRDGDRYVTFGLMRGAGAKGDGSREARVASQLVPHLSRVIRLRHEAARLRSRALAGQAGVDALPFAALVLDRAGHVLVSNAAADLLLRTGDGLRSTPAGLVANRPADTQALRRAVAAVFEPALAPGRDVLRLARPSGAALAVVVSPFIAPSGERLAVIHVLDPDASNEPTAKLLRALFSLSPAETRVALSVAEGRSPAEAAAALGLALTTVRSQLRAVFQKTQTRRQAELARLLASLGAREA